MKDNLSVYASVIENNKLIKGILRIEKQKIVFVWLDEEHTEYEILATNLPRDQFSLNCFGEIYHLRWRIETAYQTLSAVYFAG